MMEGSAEISPCGTYRYQLDRWAVGAGRPYGPKVAWIMVNPSTADALSDDATIRKIKGFSERMGCNRFTIGNLFAYRAKDIKALKTANAPIGPLNDEYLDRIIQDADRVMVAWGPAAKLPKNLRSRWRSIRPLADGHDQKLFCLGTAKDGQPLHPLMQPYSAEIAEWPTPNDRNISRPNVPLRIPADTDPLNGLAGQRPERRRRSDGKRSNAG